MAARTYGLFEDQNAAGFNHAAFVGGKPGGLKAVKKGMVSGRKPLGDLSNSVNPIPTQGSKKLNANSFALKEPAFSKVTNGASKKKNISNASEKKLQVSGRKPLGDISNSGKPAAVARSTKNLKTTGKLGVVLEDSVHHDSFKEEGFLHDHRECIKAQKQPMDVDEFLKIVGLNNGYTQQSLSTLPSLSGVSKLKPDNSPFTTFDLEEMLEELPLKQDDHPTSPRIFELSSPLGISNSDNHRISWIDDDEVINFRLIGSPPRLRL